MLPFLFGGCTVERGEGSERAVFVLLLSLPEEGDRSTRRQVYTVQPKTTSGSHPSAAI